MPRKKIVSRSTTTWTPEQLARLRASLESGVAHIRSVVDERHEEWLARYGRPAPIELGELETEATRAGVPFNAIQDGTFASLTPYVEGHLQRLQDEERIAKLKRESSVAPSPEVPEPPYLGIVLDATERTLARNDFEPVKLPDQQFKLCKAIYDAGQKGVSVGSLKRSIWRGSPPDTSRSCLDNCASKTNKRLARLRIKIIRNGQNVWTLLAI